VAPIGHTKKRVRCEGGAVVVAPANRIDSLAAPEASLPVLAGLAQAFFGGGCGEGLMEVGVVGDRVAPGLPAVGDAAVDEGGKLAAGPSPHEARLSACHPE
jgi:hypothetical protein